jgi:hypothetical protein
MIPSLALLILFNTGISDDAILKELRLYLVILSRLALALGSGATGNEILNDYLTGIRTYINGELRESLRL